MQKTFNVWVKRNYNHYVVCSKIIEEQDTDALQLVKIKKHDTAIDGGASIRWCDVSHWLKTLDIKESEVKSFKLTFKEN